MKRKRIQLLQFQSELCFNPLNVDNILRVSLGCSSKSTRFCLAYFTLYDSLTVCSRSSKAWTLKENINPKVFIHCS